MESGILYDAKLKNDKLKPLRGYNMAGHVKVQLVILSQNAKSKGVLIIFWGNIPNHTCVALTDLQSDMKFMHSDLI